MKNKKDGLKRREDRKRKKKSKRPKLNNHILTTHIFI